MRAPGRTEGVRHPERPRVVIGEAVERDLCRDGEDARGLGDGGHGPGSLPDRAGMRRVAGPVGPGCYPPSVSRTTTVSFSGTVTVTVFSSDRPSTRRRNPVHPGARRRLEHRGGAERARPVEHLVARRRAEDREEAGATGWRDGLERGRGGARGRRQRRRDAPRGAREVVRRAHRDPGRGDGGPRRRRPMRGLRRGGARRVARTGRSAGARRNGHRASPW